MPCRGDKATAAQRGCARTGIVGPRECQFREQVLRSLLLALGERGLDRVRPEWINARIAVSGPRIVTWKSAQVAVRGGRVAEREFEVPEHSDIVRFERYFLSRT